MRNTRKTFTAFIAIMVMLSSSFITFAEGEVTTTSEPESSVVASSLAPLAPVAQASVQGSLGSNYNVVITWDDVENATSYKIKFWDSNDSEPAESTDAESGVEFPVTAGSTYSYKVGSFYTDEELVEHTVWSEATTVQTSFDFSAPVITKAGLKYSYNEDNVVYFTWTMTNADQVTSYELLSGDTANIDFMEVVETVDDPTVCTCKHTQTIATAYYAVRAKVDGVYQTSAITSAIKVKTTFINEVSGLVWTSSAKTRCRLYANSTGSKKIKTVARGTKFYCIGRYPTKIKKFKDPKRVQVRLVNGQIGWVSYSQCKGGVKANTIVTRDYSRSVKEDFVNSKGYESDTSWLVWMSPHTQRVYIFRGSKGNWSLTKTFRVTTGKFSHPTKASQKTIFKKKATSTMVNPDGRLYYYKYCSYFSSGVSYHSGCWWSDTGKTKNTVVKSGKPMTFGCARMYTSEAKYIYSNVPKGSKSIVTETA